MALENNQGGKFITILGGKFCERVPEGTPGATVRVNKNGKTVHEKYYDSFTGKLVGIRVQESPQYGKSWVFDFKDKGEVYHLQLSYSNSFATALLKMLPNVDLSQEMKVSPSAKEVDGKNRSSLFINQNGITLKHAYTRAVPNGMPDMEQVMVKGSLVWDDTKRIAFLHDMVVSTVLPKLAALGVMLASPAPFVPEQLESTAPEADEGF